MKNLLRFILSASLLLLAGSPSRSQVAPAFAAQGASAGQTGASGPGSGSVTSVTVNPSSTVTGVVTNPTTDVGITLTAIQNPSPSGNSLLSDGVAWVSGYTFSASPATYVIQGVNYTSPLTQVTLGAADATLDRFDIIAVNTSGAVVVVPGTLSATPELPDLDTSTQLQLTFVLVTHATTQPVDINNVDIYHEGTEWTMSRSGSTFNLTSTNNPHGGTKSIEGTNVTTGNSFTATSPVLIDLADNNQLVFWVAPKSPAMAATRQFSIQWFTNNTARGSILTFKNGTYGFNASSTAYQQIVVPLSVFGANGIQVNKLRFLVAGTGATFGIYFDDISLQGGTAPIVDSTSVHWKGPWVSTTSYNIYDEVSRGGVLYSATAPGVGNTPSSSSAFWQVKVDASLSVAGTVGKWSVQTTNGVATGTLPDALDFTTNTVTAGTFVGPTEQGYTLTGASRIIYTPMPALAVNMTLPGNSYSATGNVTFTYSAASAPAGTATSLRITADSSDRTITIPSTWSIERNVAITSLLVPATTTLEVGLTYIGGQWEITGDPLPATGTGAYVLQDQPSITTNLTVPKITYTTSVIELYGSGTPEGSVTANIGSVYHRTNGSTGTTLYVKESGTGNTGWAAVSAGGSGTVTSVGLTMPPGFGVASSPVTTSGTIAVTDSASANISSTAIDWSTAKVFSKTLGANTTFTFSNTTDGQTIVVSLTNTASNYTVTWPTVSWSGGVAPTQTIGAKTDVYTFIKIGSTFYGSVVQNF